MDALCQTSNLFNGGQGQYFLASGAEDKISVGIQKVSRTEKICTFIQNYIGGF